MSLIENENTQAKDAWNRNAEFWDERMGEGNDFFNILSLASRREVQSR
jgi:hypothetical protein